MIKTEMISIQEENAEKEAERLLIERAGAVLSGGGLVAFPTETVYGLGGDALQKQSSEKIYAAKGRPSDNPLIVHICCMEALEKIVTEIPDKARVLAEKFWPGPLTMIFKKSDAVPYETTGGLDTVAVRMPENKIALALIRAAGGYVAAPSANTSGKPSPTLAEHVKEDLDGRIDMILDGGSACIGLESTIIDLTEQVPMLLRPGFITKEMLEQALGTEVLTDQTLLDGASKQPPKAPGMKYRHYAPKGELTIVSGSACAVTDAIRRMADQKRQAGEKVGIICTDETRKLYQADLIESAGSRMDEEEIARRLYAILRRFDAEQVTCIYSEAFSEKGMGQAIMNRLLKAAGHHVMDADGGSRK